MMNRIQQEKKRYVSFHGRIGRKAFWLRLLTVYVLFQILGAAGACFLSPLGNQAVQGYSFLIASAFLLSQASLWVRRFHDRNVSGYWYGIVFLFQILTLLICIYAYAVKADLLMLLGVVSLFLSVILSLYVLFRFGFGRGTKGENDYGPDPLEEERA